MNGEVSSLPQHVELLDVNRFVREDEANGILVVKLDVFEIEGEGGKIAVESPARGVEERAVKLKRACDGRMPAELSAKIGVPEGIEIELIHAERKIGGIAATQPDVSVDLERAALEVGVADELKSVSLRAGLQIEIAGKFVIEGEIADVDIGIDHWRFGCAGGFEVEIGAAFERETIGRNLADASEIEIISGDVELEGAGGGIVGGASGEDGIVVEEMNVIEGKFAAGEVEVGIELLNGLAVGGGVVEMDLAVAVRIGFGAGGLHDKIGRAGDAGQRGRGFECWRGG